MRNILLLALCLSVLSCSSSETKDEAADENELLNDSTVVQEDGTSVDSEYDPYGKEKVLELSNTRKSFLEGLLKTQGVSDKDLSNLSAAIRNNIAFNEWDVIEEGETADTKGNNKEQVILKSLIFGPFDGNGRAYSVMAIVKPENRIYLSEEHWSNEGVDSAYNIQMATDKKLTITDKEIIIKSSKGDMTLKNVVNK